MITKKDMKYIKELLEKEYPRILKDINYDPSMKEIGHSFAQAWENKLTEYLLNLSTDFTSPDDIENSKDGSKKKERPRAMPDIVYKGNYINIKFGHNKKGQPNICAMSKLYLQLHEDTIDSYYLLVFDAYDSSIHFFDVYDYLDYVSFNYGPGQTMLKEVAFKKAYKFNQTSGLTKKEKLKRLHEMQLVALENQIKTMKKKQEMYNRILDEY